MPPEDAHRRPIVLVLGPTAGGKTSVSIELARRLPGGGTCLGADSMQIYRGMDIGTAKPTSEERAAAPHELFDLVDPDGPPFTVADWLEVAETQITATRESGRWPIVVGGTNLYVQNLLYGMDAPAPTDPALRAALDAMSDADLRSKLEQEAPEDADRIHANDRRRTIR
ncbi:MAG: isopentenyl transferase family protein, partial [Planctomycetota bacterium]|nr:isopentenyl transferase family protein [Planctomycetota bacterium]